MQASIDIYKWLMQPFLYFTLRLKRRKVPTIWVESPRFTALYYTEYLGFRIIKKQNRESKTCYLLENKSNLIWLAPSESNPGQRENLQQVTVSISNIESEYNYLKGKVKLVKPLLSGAIGERTFTLKDCNGIDLVYR